VIVGGGVRIAGKDHGEALLPKGIRGRLAMIPEGMEGLDVQRKARGEAAKIAGTLLTTLR
jgi:hypothetical protein